MLSSVVGSWGAGRVRGAACVLTVTAGCIWCSATPSAFNTNEWAAVKQRIRSKFPSVRHISTGRLAEWMSVDRAEEKPLLLDAREPEEYEVSHLEGATRALSQREALQILTSVPRERPVVVYCAVGYRSAELAAALRKAGYTNVWNMEGSIFEWSNEGRPIYRSGMPVRSVHPYDEEWGRLLRPELWYREPRDGGSTGFSAGGW
jgi:rhodanese-related sulfurtransferase